MKCCFLMTLACAVPALGQMMYNPPAAGGAPAASPASPPAVQPNAYQPSRQGDAKSLYGNELPFLNPQDGTVTINGTTLNMGSFREIEARFNKYLSQPEESTEDAKEYQKIFENTKIWRSYSNTIFYTVVGTTINIFLTMMMAYPLSRKNFFARKPLLFLAMFTMYFQGGMIPTYLWMNDLHLYNTPWVMVLLPAMNVFNLINLRQSH